MAPPAPFADIGINPPVSSPRDVEGAVATVATIKYGMVVVSDNTAASFRDVKLPAGANALQVRGVVHDLGDPNNSGLFATGDEFGVVISGPCEVLLDTGATCTKGDMACTSGTAGTVKTDTGTGNIVGQFQQTYDNSAGSAPVLVAINVNIQRAT